MAFLEVYKAASYAAFEMDCNTILPLGVGVMFFLSHAHTNFIFLLISLRFSCSLLPFVLTGLRKVWFGDGDQSHILKLCASVWSRLAVTVSNVLVYLLRCLGRPLVCYSPSLMF